VLARDNPFRTERIGGLEFRPGAESRVALFERLAARGYRGAIVGPHGSGKTTLLRELGPRLEAAGYRVHHWFLNEDLRRPSTRTLVRNARSLGQSDVLLFDGAGHLPALVWRLVAWAARDTGGLLITAHAPGRLPTVVETRTDAGLLAALLEELVGAPAAELAPLAEGLRRARDGNLREVFLDLYDLAAHDDSRLAALA
jgi:hypothetical protein